MSGNTAYVLVHLDQESGGSSVIAVTMSSAVGEAWKLQCSPLEGEPSCCHPALLCFVEEMSVSDEMDIANAVNARWSSFGGK